ncbi:unnamed protein product [Ambrosiozyma monospora]|uniref:Unnamed protein product n=1 Tax=Ambrosiozyma monospora TaxID=43982 RepID=A0ACB5U0E8_AMBMO|nr:unnamed protein product [Ambrosiozyma monospora]
MKVDIRSSPECFFKFSGESERLLKKFESQLHLWARVVKGLETLNFVQRTSTLLLARLPLSFIGPYVKAKNVVLKVVLKADDKHRQIGYWYFTRELYPNSTFPKYQSSKKSLVGFTAKKPEELLDLDVNGVWNFLNTIPREFLLSMKSSVAGISFPLSHSSMDVKYSTLMLVIGYRYNTDNLTILYTTLLNSIQSLTLVVSGFISEKSSFWQKLPDSIRNLHLVGFISKKSVELHQVGQGIENHPVQIGGLSLSRKLTESAFYLFVNLHIINDEGAPTPCYVDYYCINYDECMHYTWGNPSDNQSYYFSIEVPDISSKEFDTDIHQKGEYCFIWKGLELESKPLITISEFVEVQNE